MNGAAVANVNFNVISAPTETTLFQDDFNRTELGNNYDVASDPVTLLQCLMVQRTLPRISQRARLRSFCHRREPCKTTSRHGLRWSMSARLVLPSLFVRATLKADKSDIASGYEVDLGRLVR